MWKFTEINTYNTITLHDCRSTDIRMEGNDLIVNFPNGFGLTPQNRYNNSSRVLRTGPAQLCFKDIDPLDVYPITILKTKALFKRWVFRYGTNLALPEFLKLFQTGKYELEFLDEFHTSINGLYQCWLWRKQGRHVGDVQMEISCFNIEYRWNEITNQDW